MTAFGATNSVLRDFDPDAGGLFGFHKGAPGADDGERLAVRGGDGAVFEELDERLNEVAEVIGANFQYGISVERAMFIMNGEPFA